MNIFFDIETIPCQEPWIKEELAASIKAPAQYKKPESINAWLEENRAEQANEAWLKTSLDGTYGQVVCISWAIDEGPVNFLAVDDLTGSEEHKLIADWFLSVRKSASGTSGQRPVLVGHNVAGFDIPFIWKRSVIRSVVPPVWWPRNPKPWSESIFDTMTQWSGDRDRISMDRLCKALGLSGKDGMTGADVWPAIQAGKIDDVAAYCKADVHRTRLIYQRLNFKTNGDMEQLFGGPFIAGAAA